MTVPETKLCIHANFVLDVCCFSWPFKDRSSLHHTAASRGGKRRGEIRGRYGFIIWNLPAAPLEDLPALKELPLELAKFACTYLRKSLGLPQPADARGIWFAQELNRILLNHLIEDNGGKTLGPGVRWNLRENCVWVSNESNFSPSRRTKLGSATPCSM
jgi:hypothetical protein